MAMYDDFELFRDDYDDSEDIFEKQGETFHPEKSPLPLKLKKRKINSLSPQHNESRSQFQSGHGADPREYTRADVESENLKFLCSLQDPSFTDLLSVLSSSPSRDSRHSNSDIKLLKDIQNKKSKNLFPLNHELRDFDNQNQQPSMPPVSVQNYTSLSPESNMPGTQVPFQLQMTFAPNSSAPNPTLSYQNQVISDPLNTPNTSLQTSVLSGNQSIGSQIFGIHAAFLHPSSNKSSSIQLPSLSAFPITTASAPLDADILLSSYVPSKSFAMNNTQSKLANDPPLNYHENKSSIHEKGSKSVSKYPVYSQVCFLFLLSLFQKNLIEFISF